MSTAVDDQQGQAGGDPPPDKNASDQDDQPRRKPGAADLKRFALGVVGIVVMLYLLFNWFQGLRLFGSDIPKLVLAVIAIVGGVGGAYGLFFFLNMMVEGFARRWEDRVKPFVFLLPALGFAGFFLIFPALQTMFYSFANEDSTELVGLQNYQDVFADPDFRQILVNNFLWLLLVPISVVLVGLLVAVLTDKLSPTWEKVSKSLIFLPMAISMVGAATIWYFVYAVDPPGRNQVGLLNAIVTSLGFDPVFWLQTETFNLNDMLMMVIVVWLQTGFAMVLCSAAIKGVPEETLEAARIDGANETKTFFQIVVPQIKGTMITVFITVFLLVMKLFDIVYVMTNGNFGTNIIGVEFFQQIFINGNNGIASAIVTLLMLAVIPVLIYQVRHFKAEEAT